MLSLEFIATEFSVADYRIDTLAYDKEANAFVLIEYKNTKINSVVDQGISYLATMLNNKAHFILKFSQMKKKIFDILDINWEASKVIFISPHFTTYQEGAVNYQGMPIELWKIKNFANSTISLEQIGAKSTKNIKATNSANINEILPQLSSSMENSIKEIKTYFEDDLVSFGNAEIQDLYTNLREFILLEKEDLTVKATKLYVGFYKNRTPLLSIQIQNKAVVIWVNEKFKNINDPNGLFRDVTKIGHYGNGDSEIKITDESNIGYIQDVLRKFLASKG